MRARNIRWACWLAGMLAFAPSAAWAQGESYAPPSWQVPLPTGSTRPESGGFFINTGFVLMQASNPLENQKVAVRGFMVFDDSLGVPAGTFIGPATNALNTQQLRDDRNFQPGFTFNTGWKFKDGTALELNWLFLNNLTIGRGVTPIQQGGQGQVPNQSNNFLYTDVYNTPLEFSGPPNKVNGASEFGVFGLFNGATIMTQKFEQRFQQWELNYRVPVYETEDTQITALVGPRFAWFWEKYQLRSTNYSFDGTGGGGLGDIGIYSAITSNRMYGIHAGARCEGYWGAGFGYLLEGQGALFLNSVKERGRFETADKYGGLPASKFSRREFTIVPEMEGAIGINYFPAETIQLQLKYQGQVYFNTMSTPRPLAHDYLLPRPEWTSTIRYLHGLEASVGVHF